MISAIIALLLMVQKSGGHQLRRLFSLSHHLQGFIYNIPNVVDLTLAVVFFLLLAVAVDDQKAMRLCSSLKAHGILTPFSEMDPFAL